MKFSVLTRSNFNMLRSSNNGLLGLYVTCGALLERNFFNALSKKETFLPPFLYILPHAFQSKFIHSSEEIF
ncbi:CLUMA_CG010252, isoform A [Clunio marinus]|uniref:CLUMA_CG010252, isoform A n=1 Tax=Clunio marinus TaxID=568069 RepID=A0A1J1IEC8_9DIPT|nr:CLUMA_CG010252, isoform A [Clunio marinus]